MGSAGLGTPHTVRAGVLDVAYYETGPTEGPAVLLLHGFPHDVHSYVDVAPQPAAAGMRPIRPDLEVGFWYLHYFATERGRRGLTADRRGIAEVIWGRNSPDWDFGDTLLDRTAEAFRNEDYVEVVIHPYRHRHGLAPGDPSYEAIEQQLARQPDIPVPSITLDGEADGNFSATDGSASAAHFTGPRTHLRVPHAGHNLPQENPAAFTAAVLDLATPARAARPQLHRPS
ncbi:alpha/beta fold hydrolase [Streptomyces sp. NBC_01483]|uniref:alpha/beta fold hydrolase n=1 Tax=Streptomyces sp. NBC_01483 TaxID=2903883 RepID=UPI002E326887|nr:alpha/beta hydrolase [Streptomyces sp. NBC_01483]